MYNNIGGKIKGLARAVAIIGIIASVVAGLGMMQSSSRYMGAGDMTVSGIFFIILGSVAAWLGSLVLYGFGQLIEHVASIERQLAGTQSQSNNSQYWDRVTANQGKKGEESQPKTSPEIQPSSESRIKTANVQRVDGKITCPNCEQTQNANRTNCWNCDTRFVIRN